MVVGEDLWQLIAHEGLEGHLGVPLGLAPDGIEHNGAIARHCALNIGHSLKPVRGASSWNG